MAIDAKTLAASKKYTKETVEGAGAIKGKNCTIDSITPITGGNRVIFKWELDSGTIQTSQMDVMDGDKGETGTGISSLSIDANDHLIVTLDDGTEIDAGEMPGSSGTVYSVNGKTGAVVLKTSDIENDSDYVVDSSYVHTDNNFTTAEKTSLAQIPLDISDLQGSMLNKADKSEIPTKTSQLTNDSNFVTDASYVHTDNNFTTAEKTSLAQIPLDISDLQGSMLNKVDKVDGKGLSTEDYTTEDLTKLRALLEIRSIGTGLSLNPSTKELTATGAAITIDPSLDKTSSNAIQNQAVAIPIEALQGSMLTKATKVNGATSGNFAGLDSNGNLTDSGSKASDFLTSHQDISGKADKVSGATSGNFAGLDSNGNLTDSGSKASDFLTSHQDISGKADKVSGATNGNFAGLDSNGNLTDSGSKASDFSTVSIASNGTASESVTHQQQITIDNVATDIDGTKYMQSSTKTTADNKDTFTFTNSAITSNSSFDVYTDVFGAPVVDMSLSGNQLEVKFNSSDNVTTCKLYIK